MISNDGSVIPIPMLETETADHGPTWDMVDADNYSQQTANGPQLWETQV